MFKHFEHGCSMQGRPWWNGYDFGRAAPAGKTAAAGMDVYRIMVRSHQDQWLWQQSVVVLLEIRLAFSDSKEAACKG